MVQSHVRSARVGYHIRPDVISAVLSASYRLARPLPEYIYNPIISASLRRPLPPLVALHLCRVSTVFILPEYLLPTVPVVFVVL